MKTIQMRNFQSWYTVRVQIAHIFKAKAVQNDQRFPSQIKQLWYEQLKIWSTLDQEKNHTNIHLMK